MNWLYSLWDRLRSTYWFVPSLLAVGSIVLALLMAEVDDRVLASDLEALTWVYSGGPEGARAVLSTIAGSIITVAGTTFSITIAALSLASAQFGPRLLRNFMRDTGNQVVLGTFTATYLYCLLVLRTVRGLDSNTYVPHISVSVGVLLALVSLGVLIYFIHHIAESIQVGHVVDILSEELHQAVERLFPERLGLSGGVEIPEMDALGELSSDREGYVEAVHNEELLKISAQMDSVFRLLRRPGDFVTRGSVVLESSRPITDADKARLLRAISIGRQRTPQQDAAFAFQQVADVALRALSPSLNDPFTAMMCIDRITAGMLQLVDREIPSAARRGPDGQLRVITRPYDFEDLVESGFQPIREAASGKRAVREHLRACIELVLDKAIDPRFQAALRLQLAAF